MDQLKRTNRRTVLPKEIIHYMVDNSIKVKGLTITQYVQWFGEMKPEVRVTYIDSSMFELKGDNINHINDVLNELYSDDECSDKIYADTELPRSVGLLPEQDDNDGDIWGAGLK